MLKNKRLALGENALIFYETREQWDKNNPDKLGWKPASNRTNPLGGQYVARVPATTATDGGAKIIRGFSDTSGKGAGIRVYEYASAKANTMCRLQLEALYWLCKDAETVASQNGMSASDAKQRKEFILSVCSERGLLDYGKLIASRTLNKQWRTICPLCLEELSGHGFFSRMQQAEGREVPDITVTEINLFHIEELRTGIYNHRPYNLGWGHHHCNVVTKDSGITETLKWINAVLQRNIKHGYSIS
ncbi:MAG: BstXI family restriction endonuclease [Nitrospirae bacterium]|nr:BstXI family restriction endonuclease [Nitrospirota bacterium]